MNTQIREPKQKRSIEKKEKIIDAGWKLITTVGYYNTNTKEIAKEANVSTGIIYQYFTDKHDILIAGIMKYGEDIFYPVLKNFDQITPENFKEKIRQMIQKYIKDYKISKDVHSEIMGMVHTDEDIAHYFHEREMYLTNTFYDVLLKNHFPKENLLEKVHIMIGLMDNLCHELVYHKHHELNYDQMLECILEQIHWMFLTKKD